MTDTGNYIERSARANAQALSARLADDHQKFNQFNQQAKQMANLTVDAANLGRELGLSFQEYHLPKETELAEAYFKKHYAKTLRMSFDQFKWFIAMSRKLEQPAQTIKDVLPVMQLTFFAGDLLPLPERTEPQQSHETTPYNYFFKSLRRLQSDLDKHLKEAASWDEQTRESIREELERTKEWIERVEGKL